MSAAKAGVDSLMASIAIEYGPVGVTSNVIAPGPIEDTEGMARLAGNSVSDKDDGGDDDDQQQAAPGAPPSASVKRKGIPSGRWGAGRDIADATVFLFSEAGSYVNGHALVVDGGSWRRQSAAPVGTGRGMQYPDYLFDGSFSSKKKAAAKL